MTVVQLRPRAQRLVCSGCGAEASCDCGVPYVTPGARVAAAVAETPNASNRAIAERIGVGRSTVSRNRPTVSSETVERTGRDGRTRRLPRAPRSSLGNAELRRHNLFAGIFLSLEATLEAATGYPRNGLVTAELITKLRRVSAALTRLADRLERSL